MKSEIMVQLEILAYKKSVPFCYCCYKNAPSGKCDVCFSDDLMRSIPGVGCEYGVDWIIKELVRENLSPISQSEEFEQGLEDCYPDSIQVGWMKLDPVQVMKEMDPVSWNIALNEWLDNEVSEETLITFDEKSYFRRDDVIEFLNKEGLTL